MATVSKAKAWPAGQAAGSVNTLGPGRDPEGFSQALGQLYGLEPDIRHGRALPKHAPDQGPESPQPRRDGA